MKLTIALILGVILSLGVGFLLGIWLPSLGDATSGSAGGSGDPEILYWVAPMDPNYRRDKPGKSPMGMDLVPVYAGDAPQEQDVVTIDPKVVQNLGVRSETVQKGFLNRRIQTVGHVQYDENALHHVHTRVEGWVEKLSVKAEGDPIVEGQLLFELYSPDLVAAQQEYVLAMQSGNFSLTEASRDRLLALGSSQSDIDSLAESMEVEQRVRIVAKSDGVVAKLGVREGIYITPAAHVMSIAVLDRVWIIAEVFERQSSLIQVGQKAEFELDSMPGKTWNGEIEYIYPELDAVTRSLKVRIWLDPLEEVLRPNMFAKVNISVPGQTEVTHVPRSSLIRGGLHDRVVLELGEGRFRSVPVVAGLEADARVEITRGLKTGDRVVTSGQFLIDSESNIEEALARFEEAPDEPEINRVAVDATIRGFDREGARIRVKHGPIEAWKWPSMTMYLKVASTEVFSGFEEGAEVVLDIEKTDAGKYVVVAINSQN